MFFFISLQFSSSVNFFFQREIKENLFDILDKSEDGDGVGVIESYRDKVSDLLKKHLKYSKEEKTLLKIEFVTLSDHLFYLRGISKFIQISFFSYELFFNFFLAFLLSMCFFRHFPYLFLSKEFCFYN